MSITNAKNRKRIETVQKKAIRLITKSRYNAHTGPLFKQHNILPYDKIILQGKLHLMHAVEYNYAPSSFGDIWTKNAVRHAEHNLRNNELYNLPVIRLELFRKIPLYSLPFEWNNIGDIILHNNKNLFKNLLREKLMNEIEIV
jgi:hypothetical protein